MEQVRQTLKQLGLTQEEIEVYINTLELGTVTVLQLAKILPIPRTTIYLIIDSLLQKGLLIQTVEGKKKRYVAGIPERLLQLAHEKKNNLSESIIFLQRELPQLQALYNLKVEKPKVRYYEGIEGLKNIYEDTLTFPHLFVHCMTQNAINLMGDYLPKYFDRLIRRMIYTQEIVSDSNKDKEYQEKYSTSRNEIISIPQKYITNTDYFIYGNNVAFITYRGGRPYGVVIEDQEIADFERNRFMILWDLAKMGFIR